MRRASRRVASDRGRGAARLVLAVLVLAGGQTAGASAQQTGRLDFARSSPDSLRDQLRWHLAQSIGVAPAGRDHLATARALANDYAEAWGDSILIRQVNRFELASPRSRATKVLADSLRREGFLAFAQDGPAAAMRLWRQSRARAIAIGDSAGAAATYGNMGAGFLALAQLDSARIHLARARALATRVRDWRTLGNAWGTLGSLESRVGNDSAATAAFTRALGLRARSGDERGAAADENNLGLLAERAGDTAAARHLFSAALARNRRDGRPGAAAANLANLARLAMAEARYAQAARLYREALALHRAAGELPGAALDLLDIGGMELRLGRYREAIAAFAEAVSILDRTGPPEDAVTARADLAAAYAAVGELGTAMRILDSAAASAGDAGPSAGGLLALVRGDLAVDAEALDAADAAYARAASLYTSAGDTVGMAAAQQALGTMQLRRGDRRALRTLQAAARLQRATGDQRSAALTGLFAARARVVHGDTNGAIAGLRTAQLALRRLQDPAGEASAFAGLAWVAELRSRRAEAEAMYRAGLGRIVQASAPAVEVQLRWGLSRTLRTRGLHAQAAAELQRAVNAIERTAAGLADADLRSGLLGQTAQLYAELALTEHARGHNAAAFETSERLRSRQMRELVGRGAVAAPAGVSEPVAERERELRDQMDALQGVAPVTAPSAGAMRDAIEPAVGARREALAVARSAYGAVLAQMGRTAPAYGSLLQPPRISHRDVASHLRADEALLEYLVSDSTTLLFVVTRDSLRVFPIAIGRHDLAAAVDFARAAIMRGPADLTAEPWAPPLRRLHRLLIEPAEAGGALRGIRTLIIAPHAELHFLPFAALKPASGPRYLVERYDLAYVPSAAVWSQLQARRPAPADGRVLIVAPFTAALPGSREEAASIGRIYGSRATVVLGPQATERVFVQVAPGYSIVHLATFGVLNRRSPLFSYVAFAPEGSASGRLEVQEVFGLALRARLLVLSACETGLGAGATADVPPGDDWVGLVRAFLFAGVDNVLATLWPIEDRATSLMIPRFHADLDASAAAGALARAQRAVLGNPVTAAPRHWAGFVLVGSVR